MALAMEKEKTSIGIRIMTSIATLVTMMMIEVA